MSEVKFNDMTAVLNYGLGSQNRLADLNKLVSSRIKGYSFEELRGYFDEILIMAQEGDTKKIVQKEKRLDEIKSAFAQKRIELVKEANLLRAMRSTNDSYVENLSREITHANDYLKNRESFTGIEGRARAEALKKRIQELILTKTVAESFSGQIKLAEDNYFAMAERSWNVIMHILPLLRGRITVENSKTLTSEMKKLIFENEKTTTKQKSLFNFI